ncbi:MAG: maleylpyruvate isomerase family mycothiol-dependent enzyme [Actinomycetota bacterium]
MPIDPDAALLAERSSFHDTLLTLTDEEWDTASLCDGWRIRDVASHAVLLIDLKISTALMGILRHRGDYDAWMKGYAVELGNRPVAQILDSAKRNAASTKQPPAARPAQSAIDVFVHHHDVLLPLDREVPSDPDRLRWMADGVVAIGRPIGWGTRVKDLRLIATDIDWHYGTGPEIHGPAAAIIMAACGRDELRHQLDGDGVAELQRR